MSLMGQDKIATREFPPQYARTWANTPSGDAPYWLISVSPTGGRPNGRAPLNSDDHLSLSVHGAEGTKMPEPSAGFWIHWPASVSSGEYSYVDMTAMACLVRIWVSPRR